MVFLQKHVFSFETVGTRDINKIDRKKKFLITGKKNIPVVGVPIQRICKGMEE